MNCESAIVGWRETGTFMNGFHFIAKMFFFQGRNSMNILLLDPLHDEANVL